MKYRDHNIPWVTRSISKLISAKSYFFKLFKLGLVTEEENNRFRNKVQSIITKTQLSNYRKLFELNKSNVRKTWDILNTLVNHKHKISDIKKIIWNNREVLDYYEISEIF